MPSGRMPSSCAQTLPIRQRAVVLDVEGREALPHRFADDQRATVVADHRAVRELELPGRDARLAVRGDEDQVGVAGRATAVQIPAEVAHVCATLAIHHHVVAVEAGQAGEIGVLGLPARGVDTQELSIAHRHDEQAPIGQPAEPGRIVGDAGDRLPLPGSVDGQHALRVHVGEVQPIVRASAGPRRRRGRRSGRAGEGSASGLPGISRIARAIVAKASRTSAGAWTSSTSTPSAPIGAASLPLGWMKQTS